MARPFYFVNEALRGFFQAKLMTFVAIVTIAVTLFVLGLMAFGFLTLRHWLQSASQQASLAVYIDDKVFEDSLKCEALVGSISRLPQVAAAKLIDKDSAWSRFETMYGREMLDAVDANPFPASLEIALAPAAQSPQAVDGLKAELVRFDGVEGVYYSREWLGALKKARAWFGWGTAAVAFFLVIAMHFMIANTIKLTIYARRDIVRNMRFVGATDLYINLPFMLEGMLQGALGATLAVMALGLVRLALPDFVLYWGPWQHMFAAIALVIFLVGVVFGWIGSRSAVRKFLR